MSALSAWTQDDDPRSVTGRLQLALENYRSWAGGLGLIHNNFGTDWATELHHAEAAVFEAFEEYLADGPKSSERREVEAELEAEGLNLPLR